MSDHFLSILNTAGNDIAAAVLVIWFIRTALKERSVGNRT